MVCDVYMVQEGLQLAAHATQSHEPPYACCGRDSLEWYTAGTVPDWLLAALLSSWLVDRDVLPGRLPATSDSRVDVGVFRFCFPPSSSSSSSDPLTCQQVLMTSHAYLHNQAAQGSLCRVCANLSGAKQAEQSNMGSFGQVISVSAAHAVLMEDQAGIAMELTSVPQGEDMLDLGEPSSTPALLSGRCIELPPPFAELEAPAVGGLPRATCRFSSAISASFSMIT